MILINRNLDSKPGIELHDGAEVHGVHVIRVSAQDFPYDQPIRFLRWVEGVPEHVCIPVRTQVR